jgi:hypothetical protein
MLMNINKEMYTGEKKSLLYLQFQDTGWQIWRAGPSGDSTGFEL